jgi:hypothetical protein
MLGVGFASIIGCASEFAGASLLLLPASLLPEGDVPQAVIPPRREIAIAIFKILFIVQPLNHKVRTSSF